jgi:hypothetical protein
MECTRAARPIAGVGVDEGSNAMRIDDDGVLVDAGLDDRLAVEIGGRRVWVFAPARDGRPDVDGSRRVLARSPRALPTLIDESECSDDRHEGAPVCRIVARMKG